MTSPSAPTVSETNSLTLTEAMVRYSLEYWLSSVGITVNDTTASYTILDTNLNDNTPSKNSITVSWT